VNPETDHHVSIDRLFEAARLKSELDADSQLHLKDCELCSSQLDWMETAADLGPNEENFEPPATLTEQVLGYIQTPSLLAQLRGFVVASLSFDSFLQPAAAGVRGDDGSRQMTYGADDFEIALWLRRAENHTLTITGQVLNKTAGSMEGSSGHVDLVVEGDHIRSSALSEWGEFSFRDLPQIAYSLHISIPNRVMCIPNLPTTDDERTR
jgi:hypothetical protein